MNFVGTNKKILGVILAGGKSSRMGQDKALLSFQGMSFIDRNIALLQSINCTEICISGDIHIPNINSIPDVKTHNGPVVGIYSMLLYAFQKYDYLIILPIDMPLLQPELLEKLMINCIESDLSYYDKYYFPLCIKLSERTKNILSEIIHDTPSIKNMISKLNSYKLLVPKQQKRLFFNVNNPKEFKKLTDEDKI